MIEDAQAKTLVGESRASRHHPNIHVEAVPGGFILTHDRYWMSERREVVASPDALVAVVQKWAREAHERKAET